MFNRDFRPRLDVNKMQTNVIMSQIRAQKQKSSIKLVQPIIMHHKQAAGRKHFPRDLCRVTDITNLHLNEQQRSQSRSTGKKILRKSVSLNHIDTPKSNGKKKFQDKIIRPSFNPIRINKNRDFEIPKTSAGRKRVDHSPCNQQRQSANSPLHWNRNLF